MRLLATSLLLVAATAASALALYRLSVNTIARILKGVTIPPILLLRADEVTE